MTKDSSCYAKVFVNQMKSIGDSPLIEFFYLLGSTLKRLGDSKLSSLVGRHQSVSKCSIEELLLECDLQESMSLVRLK